LGSGWIYRIGPNGQVHGEDVARDPYFTKCAYTVGARDLIAQGFLTEPVIGGTMAEGYDTHGLVANAQGKFDADAVDRAYHGHGRKTAAIVADVVFQARDREGVMFFAATVRHAQEIMASLPPEISVLVTGETGKSERANLIKRFKAKGIKYLVNVSVLTTGFDAPHVDVIAILRKTESVGLLQQIIGRGLRVSPGKADCLILDYTTNLEDHCPDGDLFAPVVRAGKLGGGAGRQCACPDCGFVNEFTVNKDHLESKLDDAGYVLDLDGQQVMTEWGPLPGHHGRRCMNMLRTGPRGEYERCGYRWTSKECPHCSALNDIAARYCCECKGEIVDPNDKLKADFKALKRDPTQRQTDEVIRMECKPGVSQMGNKTIRIEWVTPYRQFTTWVQPEATNSRGMRDFALWNASTKGGEVTPATVTYRKDAATGFFVVMGYNGEADRAPE
jgi:DNA repair protein RadD